jgi:2-polyprenyl-3-methyl-5-hydroxy-6-metoxy-1,4-benzoquinol methylase
VAVSYYDTHAAEFVGRTVDVDLAHLRQRFTDKLPLGGRVLDAGCGSGRDSKAFVDAGFRVMAFDASPEMVRAATELTGLDVIECNFREFRSEEPFEGIWACASLLHVPRGELGQTLEHLIGLLRPAGVLYASLKFGSDERMDGERYFNDVTPESFSALVATLGGAVLEDLWVTNGVRDSDVRWVNALVRKTDTGEP